MIAKRPIVLMLLAALPLVAVTALACNAQQLATPTAAPVPLDELALEAGATRVAEAITSADSTVAVAPPTEAAAAQVPDARGPTPSTATSLAAGTVGRAPAPTAPAKPTPAAQLAVAPSAADGVVNVPGASWPGSTGLSNVPIGVPVILTGGSADPESPAQRLTWTLAGPNASKATLDRADTKIVKFTPDVTGVYKIDLVVATDAGSSAMASVQLRGGTYIGFEAGKCGTCHTSEAAGWQRTSHSTVLKRQLDGGADPKSSRYGEACLRCHTTGYFASAKNGGFADLQTQTGWKFPSLTAIQSGKGNWDALPVALKNVANVQCEACHGPAKDHVSGKVAGATSLSDGLCNTCHDGGADYAIGTQARYAKHGSSSQRAWMDVADPSRQECVRCHSGAGYISFTKDPIEIATWDDKATPLTCAACHDPHGANPFQLRIAGKPVGVSGITKDFALSATCVECHWAGSIAAETVDTAAIPHSGAAAEMLGNTGGVTYGQRIADSPHGMLVGGTPMKDPSDKAGNRLLFGGLAPGPCVACHMYPAPPEARDPNANKVGGHSLNTVSPDGKTDYTAPCLSCHAGAKDFAFTAKADYDGNGKVETVQGEIAGLLGVLRTAISASGISPTAVLADVALADRVGWTVKQRNAVYNYLLVRGRASDDGRAAAIHNFKRAVALIQLSYRDLTGKDVPNAKIASS